MLDVGFGIIGGRVGDAVPIFNRECGKLAGDPPLGRTHGLDAYDPFLMWAGRPRFLRAGGF